MCAREQSRDDSTSDMQTLLSSLRLLPSSFTLGFLLSQSAEGWEKRCDAQVASLKQRTAYLLKLKNAFIHHLEVHSRDYQVDKDKEDSGEC